MKPDHIVQLKDVPSLLNKYPSYHKPSEIECINRMKLPTKQNEEMKQINYFPQVYDFLKDNDWRTYTSFTENEFWEIYSLVNHNSSKFVGSLNLPDCK